MRQNGASNAPARGGNFLFSRGRAEIRKTSSRPKGGHGGGRRVGVPIKARSNKPRNIGKGA